MFNGADTNFSFLGEQISLKAYSEEWSFKVLSGVSSLSDYFFLSILSNKIVQNSLKRTGKITNYIWLTTKPWSFLKSLHNVKIIKLQTAT